jgi:hypothetical protein
MAVHARFGGRDAREGRIFDEDVAVAAIDPELSGVVLVAEGNGLHVSDVRLSDVRGPIQNGQKPAQPTENEDGPEDGQSRNGVETSVENLGHGFHLSRSRS